MRKIAILTFSRVNNYGAMLQAYALKTVLKDIGAEAEMINYKAPYLEAIFNPNPFVNRGCGNFIKKLLFLPKNVYIRQFFSSFMDKYLDGKLTYSRAELANLEKNYDCFITGSDQVFNMNLTGGDETFFLDFVKDNDKKYSYAASFGKNEITSEEETLTAPFLKLFKEISVRESTAVPLAERLSSKKVRRDIDPTLLLSAKEWLKIASIPDTKGDYILLYLLNRNAKIIEFAKNLARAKGLKMIMFTTSPFPRKAVATAASTPQEWLGYFLKAKYVVTNSFHGLAFSINFNKDFFLDLLPPPSNVNSRLENLLELTGLKGRLIDNIGDNYNAEISWGEVNSVMEKERERSKTYLKEIITK